MQYLKHGYDISTAEMIFNFWGKTDLVNFAINASLLQ